MAQVIIDLTEEEFDSRYKLRPNHIDPNASWAYDDSPGCLFETFGEELAFVRQQDPLTVWTVVDGGDDGMYITSGFHFVNRLGYLISTTPVPENVFIQVHIPMSEGDAPNPVPTE